MARPAMLSHRGMSSLCCGTGGRFSMVSSARSSLTPLRSKKANSSVTAVNPHPRPEAMPPSSPSGRSPSARSPVKTSSTWASTTPKASAPSTTASAH